jgi:hypothetical protein
MRRELTTSEAHLLLFAICNEFDLQKRCGDADGGPPGKLTTHAPSLGAAPLVGGVPSEIGADVGLDDGGLGDDENAVMDGSVEGRTKTKVCSIS